MAVTTKYGLPLLDQSNTVAEFDAAAESKVNKGTRWKAILHHAELQHVTVTDPSTLTPNEDECWYVASGAVGAWSGQDGKLAAYMDGAWDFITTTPMIAYVKTPDNWQRYNGTSWNTSLI